MWSPLHLMGQMCSHGFSSLLSHPWTRSHVADEKLGDLAGPHPTPVQGRPSHACFLCPEERQPACHPGFPLSGPQTQTGPPPCPREHRHRPSCWPLAGLAGHVWQGCRGLEAPRVLQHRWLPAAPESPYPGDPRGPAKLPWPLSAAAHGSSPDSECPSPLLPPWWQEVPEHSNPGRGAVTTQTL